MPHVILEYTNNLSSRTDIQQLVEKVNQILVEKNDTFPTGGIRVRAYETSHYCIADGKEDDAFVHAIVKIGKGRSEEVIENTCENILSTMKEHFQDYVTDHYLALSLEMIEFQRPTYKWNNIHQRFK
ncbi:5-carboxymethyl-2-hydroxymuconate Delta-isomerase [Halobacillus yeomjeoni]|uniref:5-carboxymethyl-2-hydroxymuconate Delta-isomerase n=1 Tax=Halobacillus yeomjeoni TaxID=311194 RepID=UPI001CD48FF4|nr:5-carboxymethyl-2-hydroxymuconate Delta-isomerase [Halobacillus yeomjeoni]MCA0983222.1 5-carboxymethyl-2-hydroxymuconate Delta-isomerase [Halobacillus yeomjeoni]